jgi:hypothetical protein
MTLSTAPGMHRFTWDVHYQPIDGVNRVGGPTLPIAAVGHDTVPAPTTPWVNPGQYTVKLTVNGKSYTQPIVVKQDPRVKTSAFAMQQVYTLSKAAYNGAVAAQQAVREAAAIRDQVEKRRAGASGAAADALTAFGAKLEALVGQPAGGGRGRGAGGGRGAGAGTDASGTLNGVSASLSGAMTLLQAADVQPTTLQLNTIAAARAAASRVMTRWTAFDTTELAALNATLKGAGIAAIQP